jgi:REP element-mobilizing transposase RayT
MPHSFNHCLMHCVFSTKGRAKMLTPELRERLWPYLGGIAREHQMKAMATGGADDHVHMLLSIPATIAVAKAVQTVKGVSSKWVHDTFPARKKFAWQEGYGAFSVSVSLVEKTIQYINTQEEHHRAKDFKEEFSSFLKAHGIEYDERYIWG